jgi:hypothetical protein
LTALTELRERAGDGAEAERLAKRATDAGNLRIWATGRGLTPLDHLAWMREKARDRAGAVHLRKLAADAGYLSALTVLARLRDEAGDAESAERLRRFGLEADGSPAQPW